MVKANTMNSLCKTKHSDQTWPLENILALFFPPAKQYTRRKNELPVVGLTIHINEQFHINRALETISVCGGWNTK